MINESPREWARRQYEIDGRPRATEPVKLTPGQWVIRHGLWIFLLVIVTVWEALGFIFPVAAKTPQWWDHPTISREIKAIIGTSLVGRVIATVVLALLSVVLTLHWAWRWPG